MYCYRCGQRIQPENQQCVRCSTTIMDTDELRQRLSDLEDRLAVSQEAVARLQRYVPPVIAEGLLHDQERLRGDRREATVLFVDAVGFTRLSVSLDAESVFTLINALLNKLVACVHRYGGLVDKFTGDGLMAVFGAPIAHENDAELAVRAALDMQQDAREFAPLARARLGAPVQIRIGISRGPVIAGVLGTAEQSAYTVIGETVNLAARLQSLARPGHILVNAGVRTRVQALFEFQARRLISVKGVDRPIDVYGVVRARSSPGDARGVPGITGVYLGRDAQLKQLRHLFEGFKEDPYGRLVTIVGEAGMGKSRLVAEWLSSVPAEELTVWHGRGIPYAQGTGYGLFRSLLGSALDTYTSPETWQSRVSKIFRPLINQLLGLPLASEDQRIWEQHDPERLSQLTRLAIREWMINESAHRRLVVILDDFHWADDLSREALQFLIGLIDEAQVFFCVISRLAPSLRLDREHLAARLHETIELSPLTQSQSHRLLSNLVSLEGFSETTVETILTRAEGNPFYIEEFVRMLIEKEMLHPAEGRWRLVSPVAVEDLEFPTSLRGLMLARVDRLPENLRYLVQDAAVIGMQFDRDLLQAVEQQLRGNDNVMPMIERLIDLDLLEARPQVAAGTYAFRHILTQETVYRSILRHERPELHRVVAESIEELHKHDLEPFTETLALHYDRARVKEKALSYTLRAGTRAQRRFANHEAIGYYSRALQLSQHSRHADVARWTANTGLGDVHQHIGEYEEAITCYRTALRERVAVPPAAKAEVMLKTGRAWDKLGDLEKARAWLESAASEIILDDERTPAIEAEIQGALGWLTLREGDLPMAQALLERAHALVDGTQAYNVLASILNRLGAVYFSQGHWEKATSVVQRALDIREQLGDPLGVARSSNNLGILKRDSGDWAGALQTYRRTLKAMQTIGDAEGIAIAHTNIANVYIDLGEWAKAESNLEQAYEIARRIANPYEKAQANMNLGRLYLRKGEFDGAESYIEAALSLYAQVGVSANPNIIDAYWLRALLYLEQGDTDSATEWSRRSYELLKEGMGEESGESPEWGRYYQLMGRLALARGMSDQAIHDLHHAKLVFETNHSHAEMARSAYWCAQAHLRADQPQLARDELDEARSIFQRLGAQADLSRVTQFQKGLEKATR